MALMLIPPHIVAQSFASITAADRTFPVIAPTEAGDTLLAICGGNNNSSQIPTSSVMEDSKGNVYVRDGVSAGSTPHTAVWRAQGATGGPGGGPTAALAVGDNVYIRGLNGTVAMQVGATVIAARTGPLDDFGWSFHASGVTGDILSATVSPDGPGELYIALTLNQAVGGAPLFDAPFTRDFSTANGHQQSSAHYDAEGIPGSADVTCTMHVATSAARICLWAFHPLSPPESPRGYLAGSYQNGAAPLTYRVPVTEAIPAGHAMVMTAGYGLADSSLAGATDSQGHPWRLAVNTLPQRSTSLVWAIAERAMGPGDWVDVTRAGGSATVRSMLIAVPPDDGKRWAEEFRTASGSGNNANPALDVPAVSYDETITAVIAYSGSAALLSATWPEIAVEGTGPVSRSFGRESGAGDLQQFRGTLAANAQWSMSGLALRQADAVPPAALEITTEALPRGVAGEPYFADLEAQGGAGPPFTWTSSALPPGLEIRGEAISGEPEVEWEGQVDLTVRDTASGAASVTLPLVIDPAPEPPIEPEPPEPVKAALVPVVWGTLNLNPGELPDGLTLAVTDVEGWYGTPGHESRNVDRALSDGALFGPKTTGPRIVTITGVAHGDHGALLELSRVLAAMCAGKVPVELLIGEGGEIPALAAMARCDGDGMSHAWRGAATFDYQLALTAADPRLYEADWRGAELRPAQAGEATGRDYPLEYPRRYAATTLPNTARLGNVGNVTAPVWIAYEGPLEETRLSDGGRSIRVAPLVDGQTVLVESATLAAIAPGGATRAAYILPGSAPLVLPPRAETSWSLYGSGSGTVTLRWRGAFV